MKTVLFILVLFLLVSTTTRIQQQQLEVEAAGVPANLTWDPICLSHFYKQIPPTRRPNNCTNTSICISLCHGFNTTTQQGFFASLQNSHLRAPEWSAHLLTAEQAWSALANNFARPSWKLQSSIPADAQYPVYSYLYSGSIRDFDRGHLTNKEDCDYSEPASDSTFVPTNYIPQSSSCNQQNWVALEKDVRYWVRGGKDRSVYVVVAIGYKDFAKPTWSTDGLVIPDYMVMLLCDPKAKESVAFVAESAERKCGTNDTYKMLERYRSVRGAEKYFLNGTKIFDDECRPCRVNASHWNFGSNYVVGNSTPELCSPSPSASSSSSSPSPPAGTGAPSSTPSPPQSTTTTTTTTMTSIFNTTSNSTSITYQACISLTFSSPALAKIAAASNLLFTLKKDVASVTEITKPTTRLTAVEFTSSDKKTVKYETCIVCVDDRQCKEIEKAFDNIQQAKTLAWMFATTNYLKDYDSSAGADPVFVRASASISDINSTPTPATTLAPNTDDSRKKLFIIASAAVGGILLIIVGAILYARWRRNNQGNVTKVNTSNSIDLIEKPLMSGSGSGSSIPKAFSPLGASSGSQGFKKNSQTGGEGEEDTLGIEQSQNRARGNTTTFVPDTNRLEREGSLFMSASANEAAAASAASGSGSSQEMQTMNSKEKKSANKDSNASVELSLSDDENLELDNYLNDGEDSSL